MSTLNILFEGWRFIPHGRGLAGQGLALGLVGRPHIRLFHKDLPWLGATELMAGGMHAPQQEQQLRQLALPKLAHPPDVIVRTTWGNEELPQTPALVLAPSLQGGDRAVQLSKLRMAVALTDRGVKLWAPCSFVAKRLVAGGVDAHDVVTLPFGVDGNVFHPASAPMRTFWRRRFSMDGFTFLHVGSLASHTGFPQLLVAFARLARRHSEVRLVIKSVDQLHQGPAALAAALSLLSAADLRGVIDRITYMGQAVSLVEMAGLYQAADAYLAGRGTSFGRPTLEAMACGTPTLCAPGGPSDDFAVATVVLHCAALEGLVSSESFAQGMERLMLSPDLQRSLAAAGPKWVSENWTWSHAAERLLTVVTGSRSRPI